MGLLAPRAGSIGGIWNQGADAAVAGDMTFGRGREKCLPIGHSSRKLMAWDLGVAPCNRELSREG